MSNLAKRLITAAVAVPFLVYVFYRGGWLFVGLIEAALLLGMSEYYRMVETRGFLPSRAAGMVSGFLVCLAAVTGELKLMAVALSVSAFIVIFSQLRRLDLSTIIAGSGATMFGVVYIGWLLSHAVLLRFPREMAFANQRGFFFIVLAVAGTFLADAGAFFAGRAFGKRKLAPLISPGKTIEGAAGGILGGTLGVVLSKLVFDRWLIPGEGTGMSLLHCLALGPLLVMVSIGGDLFESMLKRDAGVKDSGNLIPGHGGIMDRLDSLLFAIPLTYYYLSLVVYGGRW